ncbi:MAG: purine-nucleoside phosphorylase [Acidimicrobiia bacterium]
MTATQGPSLATDPFGTASLAAGALAERTGVASHDVAVVLGSGWGRCADIIGEGPEVRLAELPGFPQPTAIGHGASVRSVNVNGMAVLVFLGRIHLYEWDDPKPVAHGVRTAHAAGCTKVILTNGAGSLRRDWEIGQAVLISDHINVTGKSPMTGPNPPTGSRFVDLTDAYSKRLRDLAREVDPTLPEGVYMGYHGPHFESPAEIKMAGIVGADLVGMSTVLEAIAARHLGMEVMGLSLATNLAAGISPVPLDGDHVIAAGNAAAERIGRLLRAILERMAADRG